MHSSTDVKDYRFNPFARSVPLEEDMKTGLKLALAAGIGLGALGIGGKSVSALPIRGLDPALAPPADMAPSVDEVRWVCRDCRWFTAGTAAGIAVIGAVRATALTTDTA